MWVSLVVIGAVYLGQTRFFHVDEYQVTFNAALAQAETQGYLNYICAYTPLLQWVSSMANSSHEKMLSGRMLFSALLVLSLFLMWRNVRQFTSPAGRFWTLVGICLIYPFWHHGLEIRHDVLLSIGLILLFSFMLKAAKADAQQMFGVCFWAGFVAILMQGISHKALVYWPPFTLFIIWLGGFSHLLRPKPGVLRLVGANLTGMLAGASLVAASIGATGHMTDYLQTVAFFFQTSATDGYRFAPYPLFLYVAVNTPVIAVGSFAFVAWFIASILRRSALRLRSTATVIAVFLAWCVFSLLINPNAHFYNALHIIPAMVFASFFALDVVRPLMSRRFPHLAATLIWIMALFWLRGFALDLTAENSNHLQAEYATAIESLTHPDRDPVLDGMGFVQSRQPPDRDWMLHSLTMRDYRDGKRRSFSNIMEHSPSPVVLVNHRWTWLTGTEIDVLKLYYVPISDQLYVLGHQLQGLQGTVEIRHSGRYLWTCPNASPIRLAGQALRHQDTITLSAGKHAFEWAYANSGWLTWIGPNLSAYPNLPPADGKIYRL